MASGFEVRKIVRRRIFSLGACQTSHGMAAAGSRRGRAAGAYKAMARGRRFSKYIGHSQKRVTLGASTRSMTKPSGIYFDERRLLWCFAGK